MRPHLRVLSAFALAAISLALAPAALAATPEPPPTPTLESWSYAEYTGTYSGTYYDIDGVTHDQFSQDQPVSIRCTDSGCVLWGIGVGGEYQFEIDGASGEWTRDNQGSLCDDNFVAGGTLTVVATAETLNATVEVNPSGRYFCPGEIQQFGTHGAFVGTFTAGNPCVLDGGPCPPEPTVAPVAADQPGAVSTPRTASTPSVLSALAAPAQTLAPTQVALAAVLTIVLVILMALPTHLLNTAIDSSVQPRRPRSERNGLLTAALGVLAAGVISCFIDPAFGFDLASLRTLASVLVSFGVEVVLGWFLVIWLVRRSQPDVTPSFKFAPLTLLVVVATVLFTRLTGFEPGIVFGLVAGVSFGTALATSAKARVALVGLGYAFVFAVIAWIAYALTAGIAESSAMLVFARESLSAITIAGIAALPVALVPLRGLTGYEVWQWNRWAWGGAYAIGLLAFFLVLLPMPFSWGGVHASLWVWVSLYLGYAAVAVSIWATVIKPWKKGSGA